MYTGAKILTEMDEHGAENNCFLFNGQVRKKMETAQSQNEVFLYDEAESLAYRCSETSLPPKVEERREIPSTRSEGMRYGENIEQPTERSVFSGVWRPKSVYYSVQSSSKSIVKNVSGRTFMRRNDPKKDAANGETTFQNAIRSKYNEFSNTSKSIEHKSECFKNCTDEGENTDDSLDAETVLRGKNVKEIFSRKSPIFVSSSDSDEIEERNRSLVDVFSTGASEIDDEAYRYRSKTTDGAKQQTRGNENSDSQWLTSKSIVKMVLGKGDAKAKRETRDNTKRTFPPQRKLSIKHIKANTKPCSLFVEEIKRNNLVMKEDIFSSSKTNNYVHEVSETPIHQGKVVKECEKDGTNHETIGQQSHKVMKGSMEVYEAKGRSGWNENKTTRIKYDEAVRKPQLGLFETSGSSREARNQQAGHAESSAAEDTQQVKISCAPKIRAPQQLLKSIGINTNENAYSDSISAAHDSNESKTSKVVMPSSASSRYVKLPGFPEAFVKNDAFVKELRIKDGLSFESANILNTTKAVQDSSQDKIGFLEERTNDGVVGVPKQGQKECLTEMKDESTGYDSPMEHRLTQTFKDVLVEKMTVETSVQCESHAIDDHTGSTKNYHKEIMICDDCGAGVQLYNILGHPLTDMEGYLLKDSYGRFLVRLDNFGVPTTCTNGKTIFLEDGTKWEYVKGYFNIIHQRFKKNIAKLHDGYKIKNKAEYPALRPFGHLKTVSKQLEWLGDISKYNASSDGNASHNNFGTRNDHNPLRQIKFKRDVANTYNSTSTLVAEMKSIAKLRKALLEKINFIADHRGPPQRFPSRNETRSYKSMKRSDMMPDSSGTNWKSEPGIHKGLQRTRNELTSNRNVGERGDPEGKRSRNAFKYTTTHRFHSPHTSTQCVHEVQGTFPATTTVRNPQPVFNTNSNQRQNQSQFSNELTILRDEKFPPVSDHSSFEPWSDASPSTSNVQLITAQTHKWSAMRPSIESDSDEIGF